MIKQTINQNQFINAFISLEAEKFSYNGLIALYDYLENIGEDIELDVVSICCDYSEYATAHEVAGEYFDYDGMIYDEEGDETMTNDEVEASALNYLNDRTTVISFDGGIIINNF